MKNVWGAHGAAAMSSSISGDQIEELPGETGEL